MHDSAIFSLLLQIEMLIVDDKKDTRYMKQEYARVSVEMPENDTKKTLRQELTYEIENNDIQDEYTVKF